MSRDVIERIRDRWQKLRLLRSRGTVLVDYKILRNFVRIYKRPEKKHDSSILGICSPAADSGHRRSERRDERATGGFRRKCAIHRYGAQPGRKKVADPVTGRMVNPSSPPIPGQQSRAKGSSIALVLPVEYSTASWRRALLSLEEHQKARCSGTTATISAGSTRRQSPGGHGSNSARSWLACALQRKRLIASVNLSGWQRRTSKPRWQAGRRMNTKSLPPVGVTPKNWSETFTERWEEMKTTLRRLDSDALLQVTRSRSQQKATNLDVSLAKLD